jgi:hypothetical protein
MKTSELPIDSIEGHKIIDSDGSCSYVSEYFPQDYKQMDESTSLSYLNQMKNLILSSTKNANGNDLKSTLLERIKESKKSESFKFYKLDNHFFVESPKELKILDSIGNFNYYDYFLSSADDFYSDIIFGEDFFKINGEYFRLINCFDFPEFIQPFSLSHLADHVISFSRLSQESAVSSLKNTRKLHVGNMAKNIRDIESEKSYLESENLLEDIVSGTEGLFEVEMWFIVKASTEEELKFKTLNLISNLKSLNVVPLIETKLSFGVVVPGIFFGVASSFKRSHQLTATYLTSLLPLDREYLFSEGLELRSRSGIPLYFDNFTSNAENFNVAITGPTGVGKSVFAQKLVDHARLQNRSVVIIDMGASFSKYMEYYGGNVFSTQFNPMEFKNPLFLKEFILAFIPESEISTKEKGKLFLEIENALESGVRTFFELINFLEAKIPDISYYFSEIWPYITNSLSEKSKLTYVDLSIYPESIIPGVILFTIEYFKNLGSEDEYRILLIDECWKLLSRNHEYIAQCFRTFRKHGCSAISITQNIEDLISLGSISTAILGNCNFKIVFRQTISEASRKFFSEHEIDLISTINSDKGNFSEFLIIAQDGQTKKVARYYASDLEYAIFNTSKSDKIKWEKFKDKYSDIFTIKEIMNAYVLLNGDTHE